MPFRAIIPVVESQVAERARPRPSRGRALVKSPREIPPHSGALRPIFLPHLVAALAAVALTVVPDPVVALRLLTGVSTTYALYMAWSRGRAYLVPSGVYFMASGVFIGLAALYLTQVGSLNEWDVLRDWAVVAFVTTAATGAVLAGISLRWQLSWPTEAELRSGPRLPRPRTPLNFQLIAISLVLFSRLPMIRSLNTALASAIGVSGVLMLTLAASSRRVRMRWHGDIVLVALAVVIPVVWMRLDFDGGGRLTLAGLGIATLVGWSLVRPRRIQKILVVMAIPGFLLFAGINRLEKDGTRNANSSNVLTSGEGLSSMYGPLDTWTELVQVTPKEQEHVQGRSVGPRFGQTFLNTLFLPVPRSVWEHKPKGFGAELTEILRPTLLREHRIAPEHSMAALIDGEFYVNFGVFGLVLLPFALAWFLAVLDRYHLRISKTGLLTVDDWFRATILVCLVSSLGDLFWVGTFTFFSRAGLSAIVTYFVWRLTTRPDIGGATRRLK